MRILVISNYYPPCRYGWGHMQLCEQVTDGLAARGHAIAVLTSTYRDGAEIARDYPVYRLLPLDPDWHCGKSVAWQFFVGRRGRERRSVAALRRLVDEFRPDLTFVWHYRYLPRLLLHQAERLPGVVVAYYMADYVPEMPDEHLDYWHVPPVHWAAKLVKRPTVKLADWILAREGKPIRLQYEHVICVSHYVRQRLVSKGLIPPQAVVIHNGIEPSLFSQEGQALPDFGSGLRCLIAGRVVPDKGIHTAIEALAYLEATGRQLDITLTILGDGPVGYVDRLQALVSAQRLQDRVEFRPPVPREEMPQVLSQYNTLILPSEYQEPLARAMQEAMAMGLLVVGTTTGGSGELLIHEETGLAFEPGNPVALAAQLVRAVAEPTLAARLAAAGRQAVLERFTIDRTIEQIETHLLSLVESRTVSLPS